MITNTGLGILLAVFATSFLSLCDCVFDEWEVTSGTEGLKGINLATLFR